MPDLSTAPSSRSPAPAARYTQVREQTLRLAAPLSAEDCTVQSMPDASPAKWHLAHTAWFFEQFVLAPHVPGYRMFDPQFTYLFNSYYESVGPRHSRPQRGLLTRPSLAQVLDYRRHVDEAMVQLLDRGLPPAAAAAIELTIELGLNHEQQHQELLLMDVKHLLSLNPLRPSYIYIEWPAPAGPAPAPRFREYPAGIYEIGHVSGRGFGFDNESPRHRVYLEAFALAQRPVSNGEYLEFIRDRGYQRPELWLSDGWATVLRDGFERPLYWSEELDQEFTLAGMQALDPAAPVCHVSFYEAEAFARWAGARLPTEAEWEVAAGGEPIEGNFLESGYLHPKAPLTLALSPADGGEGKTRLFGDVWEWTSSAYSPYPGFQPLAGGLGEYNGKFMANQFVLRGGCCVTPQSHIRATYRNFFYPHMRWQFGGIRLAKENRP